MYKYTDVSPHNGQTSGANSTGNLRLKSTVNND